MSRPKRSEAEQQWRRDRIVASAIEVFARDGVGGATMEEIARAAEYSPAALYNYFRSKEEILAAAFQNLSDRMAQALEAPPPPGLTFAQAFHWRARRATETVLAHRGLLLVFESPEVQALPHGPGVDPQQCNAPAVSRWSQIMADGIEQGALSPDLGAEQLAAAWIGMIRGVLKPALRTSENQTTEQWTVLTEQVVDLFLNGAMKR